MIYGEDGLQDGRTVEGVCECDQCGTRMAALDDGARYVLYACSGKSKNLT